ncbi:MAG: glutamate--cysteine ligase [Isosphaeraceae bacterium]
MSTRYRFVSNPAPTLGVEVELNLVDAQTMALRSGVSQVLGALPPGLGDSVKPELMQCYLEINTGVCKDVAEVGRDLTAKVQAVQKAAEGLGLKLFWGGTHPFSHWREQEITPNERYIGLVELLQDTARRLITFGLHVHVATDSGDKAIMICDRILNHLPTLLALSTNSPFWLGHDTGLQSQRSKVMEDLPTAGLPPLMRNWSEYVWLLNHMVSTGFIKTIREIWWDVRPHHNFGTVEVRICDMPHDLPTVLGLTALIQCLVHDLSRQIDEGTYQFDCHPFMVRQNKWRACRYGMEADLVDPLTYQTVPVKRIVDDLVRRLRPVAEELGCARELDSVNEIAARPSGAQRQVAAFRETGDMAEVVRRMISLSTL